jgi:hypothetical protein
MLCDPRQPALPLYGQRKARWSFRKGLMVAPCGEQFLGTALAHYEAFEAENKETRHGRP